MSARDAWKRYYSAVRFARRDAAEALVPAMFELMQFGVAMVRIDERGRSHHVPRDVWSLYARCKLDWLEQHPDAEADEVEDAMRRIALDLGL